MRGVSFPVSILPGEGERKLPEFLYFFYLLTSILRYPVLHKKMFWRNGPGKIFSGFGIVSKIFSWGRGVFLPERLSIGRGFPGKPFHREGILDPFGGTQDELFMEGLFVGGIFHGGIGFPGII